MLPETKAIAAAPVRPTMRKGMLAGAMKETMVATKRPASTMPAWGWSESRWRKLPNHPPEAGWEASKGLKTRERSLSGTKAMRARLAASP
ncbi:hypothetical protein GCM10007908_36460 [Rhizobium albus]|nr:hypothetical protein GCM10007908_36460 [Rhizobium albus]